MSLIPKGLRRSLRRLIGGLQPPRTISAVASATYRQRPSDNQDAVAVAACPARNLRAIIVADGLGSQEYAGLGARWSVEMVTGLIHSAAATEHPATWSATEMRELFIQARQGLRERALAFCRDENLDCDPERTFGTTLIIAIEEANSLWVGYVGNGAIWHLRGGFNDFMGNQYIPWNALNYLNPHTLQNLQGKEALYRLISIAEDDEAEPTILQLQKDGEHGDAIMICTDGIFSNDQVNLGRTKDETIWMKMEQPIVRFFEALNELFARYDAAEISNERLQAALNTYLERLCADDLLDDDSSLGVILTPELLRYQEQRTKRRRETHSHVIASEEEGGG